MNQRMLGAPLQRTALLLSVVAACAALQGCAAVAVGAVAGGTAAVAVDRRTAGTQLEDKTIEVKAESRARELLADRANVNVTVYNRVALLTGEVPTEADRTAIEAAVRRVENVKSVINDLAVAPPSALSARANDSIIAGKIRARFIDADDLSALAFKVAVERGVVYLMGMVTEEEARRATQLASAVSGVSKVVRSLEIISKEDVARLRGRADGTR